ncbi:hydroxyethylthiazole kinase [Granulibacter bethesdensis]|uniref:hydroxyethylthiazole kinase n=1 Tax=Granulibacter bethesdensis TaxID=364410 RepID=UPI0004B591BE|nr:hydroxyethylthiazole kinase [Granulibacter bethesdensis]
MAVPSLVFTSQPGSGFPSSAGGYVAPGGAHAMTEEPLSAAWLTERTIYLLTLLREKRPLVHNITNLVVTNTTANALLALGASPAMVEGVEEVDSFARMADSLVINLGTMSSPRAAAMRLAMAAARQAGKPVVLDPVAVGALRYRTELARDLLEAKPHIVRGNASEIIALAGDGGGGRGVDSLVSSTAALEAASILARRTGGAVAVTGATDYVTDGTRLIGIANGHPMMTRVTGLGCTATALIGAFAAVEPDPLVAACAGLCATGLAGELAAIRADGPGSLQVEFLDALYALDSAILRDAARWVLP